MWSQDLLKSKSLRVILKSLAIAGVLGASSATMAAIMAPPMFAQCPAFGSNTGCAVLITVNPDFTLSFANDLSQGPYDGAEDTLVGVSNNAATSVNSFNLTSTTDIFGFEGDGIVSYGAPGNAQDPSGYGGPKVFFTNIGNNFTTGTVNFIGGLAAGASTYFSLEEDLSGVTGGGLGGGGVNGGTVPEPGTLLLASAALAALVTSRRSKIRKT